MVDPRQRIIETLFQEAADLPAEERPAFLDAHCHKDSQLRAEVESLLVCMDQGRIDSLAAVEKEEALKDDLIGTCIGPYKLLELIGEGGFGTVYRAVQQEPIQREVALKVIKPGMDTKEVIARFEAERQALALMEHPHIARVLDAGAAESGRPYFVMERVKGIPITEYCDEHRVNLQERMALFITVCKAVQHAHQKGIIHRDIKPSNVLVMRHDGAAVPKVIDFGIAKATRRRSLEDTRFTRYQLLMGTPEYMSPEQAGMDGLDIDTRTDIYSLGVLLYVLLTGRTPFDTRTLHSAACGEIQRIIREQDPPTPSRQVSRIGPELARVAASRQVAPQRLRRIIRGDLDWIVMKSLEKDRNRRYVSPFDLAADLERHLAREPVQAGPPSPLYRLGRFMERHRVGVLAGLFVAAALIIGFTLALTGYLKARDATAALALEKNDAEAARERAEDAQRKEEAQRKLAEAHARTAQEEAFKYGATHEFLQEIMSSIEPSKAQGREVTMVDVLDEADRKINTGLLEDQPEVEASVRMALGKTYRALGRYDQAYLHLYRTEKIRCLHLGPEHPDTLSARSLKAVIMCDLGMFSQAEQLFPDLLAAQRHVLGENHLDTLCTLNRMGISCWRQEKYDQAEQIHGDAYERLAIRFGPDHIETLRAMINLGTVYWGQGRIDEAEEYLGQALQIATRVLGELHPETQGAQNNLGLVLQDQGKHEKAEALWRSTVHLHERVFGMYHPQTRIPRRNLVRLLILQKAYEEARPHVIHQFEDVSLRATPEGSSAFTCNEYAWILLTCFPVDLRDPEKALFMAQRAVEKSGGLDAYILDTLALAFYMNGDLDSAILVQERALAQAALHPVRSLYNLKRRHFRYLLEKGDFCSLLMTLLKEFDPIRKQGNRRPPSSRE